MSLLKRLFRAAKTQPADDGAKHQSADDGAWQVSIVQDIRAAMIRQIPEDWDSAQLFLEPTENGLGAGMRHSAITPKGADGFVLRDSAFVTPRMEVLAATRQLELACVQRKATFKRAIITAVRDADGWEVKSEYEYD